MDMDISPESLSAPQGSPAIPSPQPPPAENPSQQSTGTPLALSPGAPGEKSRASVFVQSVAHERSNGMRRSLHDSTAVC